MPELQSPMRTFAPGPLRGTIEVPGDKSISHRALIVGAAAPGALRIDGVNTGRDVRATRAALAALGARIDGDQAVTVTGSTLREPDAPIDCMNSGSTARMVLGACAGAAVRARFEGDASLSRRPMEPVAAQLRAFGARIDTTDGCLPLTLHGTPEIQTRHFILVTQSAQIKSALLFAALFSATPIAITGARNARDHTERLMRFLGARIDVQGETTTFDGTLTRVKTLAIPGDFSAAAFFIVAACVAPESELTIRNVGINPTRTGLLDALRAMGAEIVVRDEREQCGEPVADITVRHAPLHGTTFGPDIALRSIDEIPALAVAAAFARGDTKITGVRDLRTKESDRLAAIERLLAAAGIAVDVESNTLTVHGGNPVAAGACVDTQDDHRIAMATATLAAGAGPLAIESDASIDVSFPEFLQTLRSVQRG